ncbi:hypothetical protein ACLK2A_14890 [Escherichia coli]
MEVCGGHTHAIFKIGSTSYCRKTLSLSTVRRLVCACRIGRIDTSVEIASHPEVIFCTFGDAMRVPGNRVRAAGKSTRCRCAHRLLADGCVETGAGESNPQSGVLRLRF